MATNALIGIRNADGTVDYIEDEREGEPGGVGIDLNRYHTERAVRRLIAFGGAIRVRPVPYDIRPLLRPDFNMTATDEERWAVGRLYTVPSGKKAFHNVPYDSFTALHGVADWAVPVHPARRVDGPVRPGGVRRRLAVPRRRARRVSRCHARRTAHRHHPRRQGRGTARLRRGRMCRATNPPQGKETRP